MGYSKQYHNEKPITSASADHIICEVQLWAQFKEGNEEAFKTIYFNYYELLFQYANKISGNEVLSTDIIQDLFSDLWNSRKKLGEALSIKAYLLSSTRRKVLQKLKRDRKKQVIAIELLILNPDIQFSPEMLLIKEEGDYFKRTIIKNALNTLSKRQKEVIYLKFYQELSYHEIAQIMNINYQSVLNHCQRALKELRNNPSLLRVSINK